MGTGKLKYLRGGQNKNINLFWNKFFSEMGLNTLIFFHVLPALEHHTYSADDAQEGGIKIKRKTFSHKNGNFYSKSPLLDVGGFAKQGIEKYSPKD
jgi:hypothetical protein